MPRSNAPWFAPPDASSEPRRATVIGAGLAGVSIACHLDMLGWKVTLLDKHQGFAMATSGNPAGLVKPQVNYDNIHINHYFENYFQYFKSYFKNLLEVHPSIRHSLIDPFAEPTEPAPCRAARVSAWVSPRDFCRAQLYLHPGIDTRYNAEVSALRNASGRWQCIDPNGETLSDTPVCVIAAGYEKNFLLEKFKLPIEPLAGQISLLCENALTPRVTQAYYAKHYLIPLNDKRYLCGASHHRNDSLEELQTDHEQNLAGLSELFPNHHIDTTSVTGGRTGIRTVSPDHLPIIGGLYDEAFYRSAYDGLHHGQKPARFPAAKYRKGLFVFAALGSHGIGNSPFLGKLLSSLINGSTGKSEHQILELLHPARFLVRELKRKPSDRQQKRN